MPRSPSKAAQAWSEPRHACVCNVVVPPARTPAQLAGDMKVWLASASSSSSHQLACSLTTSEVAMLVVVLEDSK
jgi:hypothetical protein